MTIIVGDGKELRVTHIGTVTLITPNGFKIILKNTLCVPKLHKNLISIIKLTSDFPFQFSLKSNCFVLENVHTKEMILKGNSVAGLCHIKTNYDKSGQAYSAPSKVWHNCICHPSPDIFKFFKSDPSVCVGNNKDYKICLLGKSQKLPFK